MRKIVETGVTRTKGICLFRIEVASVNKRECRSCCARCGVICTQENNRTGVKSSGGAKRAPVEGREKKRATRLGQSARTWYTPAVSISCRINLDN